MNKEDPIEELQRCIDDPVYFREHYCTIKDGKMHWTLPEAAKWRYLEVNPGSLHPQRRINAMLSLLPQWAIDSLLRPILYVPLGNDMPPGKNLPVPMSHYLP